MPYVNIQQKIRILKAAKNSESKSQTRLKLKNQSFSDKTYLANFTLH